MIKEVVTDIHYVADFTCCFRRVPPCGLVENELTADLLVSVVIICFLCFSLSAFLLVSQAPICSDNGRRSLMFVFVHVAMSRRLISLEMFLRTTRNSVETLRITNDTSSCLDKLQTKPKLTCRNKRTVLK